MASKKMTALLLGVACLLLVVALGYNNLNRSSAIIATQSGVPSQEINMSWLELLNNELTVNTVPPSIIKIENDSIIIPFSDTSALKKSVVFSTQNRYSGTAVYLQLALASLTNSSTDWSMAGQYAYSFAVQVPDTNKRDFLMHEAISCFDRVLEKETTNRMATLYKGLALADKRETMMNAVPLLLQVVKEDSSNILANYTLGMLAVESGQLDKALTRFEKLISLQPSNAEYHFQAARTLEIMGNKELSLKYYNQSLELTQNPEIREQLKEIINQLK